MFPYDPDSQSYYGTINDVECAIDIKNNMYVDGLTITPDQAEAIVMLWSWRNTLPKVEALLRSLQPSDE
jgi:hypothetical protein